VSPERSDRDLVVAFKRGDREAYDEMYARYHPRVYGVCSRILRNPQDAEEASQETFLRAYQALHRFNGRYQLGAWLARIAANTSVDQLRSRARTPVVALPDTQEPLSSDAGPETLVVGEYPRLTAAIEEVKPLHAQALALRALEGMSHQEIADRLAMSPAQVKALLHRARTSLRRAWNHAEGWLLAPALSIRSLVGDRSEGQAPPLLSAGGTLSPLLAERVAATALAVAVALGGFPTTAPRTQVTEPRAAARPSVQNVAVRPESKQALYQEPPDGTETAPGTGEVLTDDVTRLIEDTLKGHTHLNPEKKKPTSEDDQTSSDPVVTATEILEEARNALPQGGPGAVDQDPL